MTYPTFVARAGLLCALATLAFRGIEAQQSVQLSEAARVEIRARRQLDSGKYVESRQAFAAMLPLARTRSDSASAFFGRAFAEQQLIESDSLAEPIADRLIRDYRRAQQLDRARYGDAAQFNIALLYSSAGDHDSAAVAYVRASQTSETRTGPLLLSAARELRMAGQLAAALSRARQAARHRAVAPEAQAFLIELHRDMRDMASLVRLADTLQSPSAPLAQVNAALADMMRDPRWASTPWAERCLILMARNYAALDIGPTYFTETQRAPLEGAVAANAGTAIAPAIQALLDVYRIRDSTNVYKGESGGSWWMQRTRDDRRRPIWSTTLRSLGDWYNRAGFNKVAISFYEAALGAPTFPVHEEWVDPEALPPLPALYATLPDTGALWDRLYRVEDLTKALFEGKSSVRPGNDRRLRVMRLTLGHLFAQQGRWDNAWHGAIYQLEESRRLAQRMSAQTPNASVYYPPEIYELLFAEYVRRGCSAEALSVAQDLHAEYARRRAQADMDRIASEVRRLRQAPSAPSGVSCSGSNVGTN
jgi:hypothetical protein